jgi:thioredoxin-dependent peroxiredoxin
MNTKLKITQKAPDFSTEDVLGNPINLSDLKGKRVFIAFLRNTNCPLCSLHVLKLSKIADKLKADGLEIIVFYESSKKMFTYSAFFKENVFADNKFSVISDPERKIYSLYGAEINAQKASLEAIKNAGRFAEVEEASRYGITGNGQEECTNPDAIPADFLIDENLIVQYAHYGNDAGDNIDLKLVEAFALTGKV